MTYTGVMPQLGYGTWRRMGDECVACVEAALACGYRHIDTAERYQNEAEIGRALAAAALPRDELFVTSKVWFDHFAPAEMRAALEGSLGKLRLDRLDLYLIHWPADVGGPAVEDYMATLAGLQDEGLVTHIGVSNHPAALLARAQAAIPGRAIATNQVEVHPYFQNRALAADCAAMGVPLTAYLPLAKGAIATDPVIGAIAAELGATVGQVTLAFLMAEGHCVIPSSSRPERIAENFAARDLRLNENQIARLRGLDRGERLTKGMVPIAW